MYLLESPRRGDSNKYTKLMIHKNCSTVSVIRAVDGSTSSFFITAQFDLTAKSFVTKSECRYNEGPLYH